MVITLSFHLSKEGVSREQFDKLRNKYLENAVKVKLLIWHKGLGKVTIIWPIKKDTVVKSL